MVVLLGDYKAHDFDDYDYYHFGDDGRKVMAVWKKLRTIWYAKGLQAFGNDGCGSSIWSNKFAAIPLQHTRKIFIMGFSGGQRCNGEGKKTHTHYGITWKR